MYPDPNSHPPPHGPQLEPPLPPISPPTKPWWKTPWWKLKLSIGASILIGIAVILYFGVRDAVHTARASAQHSDSLSNLYGQVLAFHHYTWKDVGLPPHSTLDHNGNALHGWWTQVLPYSNHEELYDRIDLTKPWDHPDNAPVFQTHLSFACGNDDRHRVASGEFGLTTYTANSHLLGAGRSLRLEDISDGTAYTILTGEIVEALPPWGRPGNVRDPAIGLNCGPLSFGSPWENSVNIGLANGQVRSLSKNIDPSILKALATPNGGETVDLENW